MPLRVIQTEPGVRQYKGNAAAHGKRKRHAASGMHMSASAAGLPDSGAAGAAGELRSTQETQGASLAAAPCVVLIISGRVGGRGADLDQLLD